MSRYSAVQTVNFVSPSPGSTVLGTLALGMSSNSWFKMTGANLPTGLNYWSHQKQQSPAGASGLPGYCDRMARDPTQASPKMYYIGCDHAAPELFLTFNETQNSWSSSSVPWGILVDGQTIHGYEHIAWDHLHNKLWFRQYSSNNLRRWDGGTNWATISYASQYSYPAAAVGTCFFPEYGANGAIIVYGDENGTQGRMIAVDPVTNGVTSIASGATLDPSGDPHNVAQYSPIHKIVVFGQGNGSLAMWRVGSSGAPTRLDNAPSQIGPTTNGLLMFNNPLTGDFIVMSITNSAQWWDFHPMAASGSQWVARSGTTTIIASNPPTGGNMFPACPIHEYGVVAFVKPYNMDLDAEMWLYKPSAAYTSVFPLTENPIAETTLNPTISGVSKWVNGHSVGGYWQDVRTTGGHAVATGVCPDNTYNDDIAVLATSFATFPANQFAEGVVYRASGYTPGSNAHEIELLLRFNITSNQARGYEFFWGLRSNGTAYLNIASWDGAPTQYHEWGSVSVAAPQDGDVFRVEVSGVNLKGYINGTLAISMASDYAASNYGGNQYASGQPGIGFYPATGATPASLGWKKVTFGSLA